MAASFTVPMLTASASEDVVYVYEPNGASWNDTGIAASSLQVLDNEEYGKQKGDKYVKSTGAPGKWGALLYLYTTNMNPVPADCHDKFMVFETEFVPVQNIGKLRVESVGSKALVKEFSITNAIPNQWNKLKIVYDPTSGLSAYELNGKQTYDTNYGGIYPTEWAEGKNDFKLIFTGADGTQDQIIYFDNTKLYGTDTVELLNDKFNTNDASIYYARLAGNGHTIESGLAGKTADEKSIKYLTTTKYAQLGTKIPASAKYVKFEYNVMPISVGGSISCAMLKNNTAFGSMATTNKRMIANQWNKVEVIIENKTGLDTSSSDMTYSYDTYVSTGYADHKVNSVQANVKEAATDTWYQLRIMESSSDATAGDIFCLDDFKVTVSNEPIAANADYPLEASANVDITEATKRDTQFENGSVSAHVYATPAEFSIENGSVRVYTDNTFATQVADDAKIPDGAVIVSEDNNNYFKYYNYTYASDIHEIVNTDKMEIANANIGGVVIKTPVGAFKDSSDVSIKDVTTGSYVSIKNIYSDSDKVFVDADLEIDKNYQLTVKGGAKGDNGTYIGEDYVKGFSFSKVYEKTAADVKASNPDSVKWESESGDLVFTTLAIPTQQQAFENSSTIFDIAPMREQNNKADWASIGYYNASNQALLSLYNPNDGYRGQFATLTVGGTQVGTNVKLETPLGDYCGIYGLDKDKNPATHLLESFCDFNRGSVIAKEDAKTHATHKELYTVTDNTIEIKSNYSGAMQHAWVYTDNAITSNGYVKMNSSGRRAYIVKDIIITQPKFFDMGTNTVNSIDLLSADEYGVGLDMAIGTPYNTSNFTITDTTTDKNVNITNVRANGDTILLDASLVKNRVYTVNVKAGTQGANGTYVGGDYTQYFKFSNVETMSDKSWYTHNDDQANFDHNSDQYGDYVSLYSTQAQTSDNYRNATVTYSIARYAHTGKNMVSFGMDKIRYVAQNGVHNITAYHNTALDSKYDVSIGTEGKWGLDGDYAQYKKSVQASNSIPVGEYAIDPDKETSGAHPVLITDGHFTFNKTVAPHKEVYRMVDDTIEIYLNNENVYSFYDSEGLLAESGKVTVSASSESLMKVYDFCVTQVQLLDGPEVLDPTAVVSNAQDIQGEEIASDKALAFVTTISNPSFVNLADKTIGYKLYVNGDASVTENQRAYVKSLADLAGVEAETVKFGLIISYDTVKDGFSSLNVVEGDTLIK